LRVSYVTLNLRGRNETDGIIASNGAFLKYCKPVPMKEECPWARGKENADRLWALSEKLVGENFDY